MTEYHVGDVVEIVRRGTVTTEWPDRRFIEVDRISYYSDQFDVRLITPAPRRWKVGDVVESDDYQDESIPNGTVVAYGRGSKPSLVKRNGRWDALQNSNVHTKPWVSRKILYLPEA